MNSIIVFLPPNDSLSVKCLISAGAYILTLKVVPTSSQTELFEEREPNICIITFFAKKLTI